MKHVIMSNRNLSVRSRGLEQFKLAVALAMNGQRVKGWKDDPEKGMILYWVVPAGDPSVVPMPVQSDDADFVAGMIWLWLVTLENERYHERAGGEVHNERAWRVYNEDWGHVAGQYEALFAVEPVWGWLGK